MVFTVTIPDLICHDIKDGRLITPFRVKTRIAKAVLPAGLLCALLLLVGLSLGEAPELAANASEIDKPLTGADYPWQLELSDSDGQIINLSDYRGRTLLLSFFYATCGYACPIQTDRLAKVQKSLKAETLAASRFVSVSIHPRRDTPRVINAFKQPYGIKEAHWQFGAPTDTHALNQLLLKAGISTEAVNSLAQTDHTMKILLINPTGKVMQRYIGDKFSIKRVAKEIESLVRLTSRS